MLYSILIIFFWYHVSLFQKSEFLRLKTLKMRKNSCFLAFGRRYICSIRHFANLIPIEMKSICFIQFYWIPMKIKHTLKKHFVQKGNDSIGVYESSISSIWAIKSCSVEIFQTLLCIKNILLSSNYSFILSVQWTSSLHIYLPKIQETHVIP